MSYLTEELWPRATTSRLCQRRLADAARLVPTCERSLRLDEHCIDHFRTRCASSSRSSARPPRSTSCISTWTTCLPLVAAPRPAPHHDLHGRLDIPDLVPLYREFPDEPVVSISDAQRRRSVDQLAATVHTAPARPSGAGSGGGGYLAFVGAFAGERAVEAIRIARAGLAAAPCRQGGSVDRGSSATRSSPCWAATWSGSARSAKRNAEFLGRADAVLFPIDCPSLSPGLIEAMACGTRGAYPGLGGEIMEPGDRLRGEGRGAAWPPSPTRSGWTAARPRRLRAAFTRAAWRRYVPSTSGCSTFGGGVLRSHGRGER